MQGPRSPREAEYSDIISFLNAKLRPDSPWSIEAEYPTAFAPSNQRNLRVITEGDQIVSHAVWSPLLVKSPQAVYKFACIGSVVTSEAHRNQGLSREILQNCLLAAQAEDCDFAILWTDLFEFYQKLGFELAGSEILAEINGPLLETLPKTWRFEESLRVDPKALLRLYNKHTVASVRTEAQVRDFLKIPNTRVYTAWDLHGQLAAYVVEGKGADLQGCLHEWGGGVDALLALVSHVQHQQGRSLYWMIPYHCRNLIHTLQQKQVPMHHGMLGMLKLLQPERFAQKLEKFLSGGCHRSDIQIRVDREGFRFSTQHSSVYFSQQDLVQYAFGPKVPLCATQMDAKDFSSISSCLPMPLWIWGWDSI